MAAAGSCPELAVALTHNEQRAAVPVPVTDAWLAEGLEAVHYEHASAVDPEGFVTVSELRDLRAERSGFVLVQPDNEGAAHRREQRFRPLSGVTHPARQ